MPQKSFRFVAGGRFSDKVPHSNSGPTADQLATLQSISADLAAAVDAVALAERVVEDLHSRFGYEMPSVYFLHADGSLHLAAQIGYRQHFAIIPDGQGIIGRVLHERASVLVREASAEPAFLFAEPDVSSEVCVPILSGSQLHGVVNVETRRREGLDQSDVMLLELLARMMAVSLRNIESQRSLTTLLANLPGMAYRCRNDRDWTTEFVSEGCFELTGYPVAAFTNHEVMYGDLIHPDDRARLWEDTQAALSSGRTFQQVYRIRTATNQEKWVWEQGCGVTGPRGDVVALEGFVADITERKRAEAALEASAAQYRQMFEQNRAIKLVIDPSTGAIGEANQAACDFYGYDAETIRTKTISDIFVAPPSDVLAELSRAVSLERSYFTFQHRLRSGTVRDVELHAGPVDAGERQVLYLIVHDITEHANARKKRWRIRRCTTV